MNVLTVSRLLCLLIFVHCSIIVATAQTDTANVFIGQVSCNGASDGSIATQIIGGPGPIQYTFNTGVTGYATGSCTYSVNLNNPGNALSQFQIQVNVNLASGMNPNFSDVVFMDSVGNLYPFWLKDFPTANSAVFWVRVPFIPAGNSTFYLSFCGSSAVSASDPITTFEFFEDFDGGTLAPWVGTCINIDVAGESCASAVSNTQFFSPGFSLYLTGASSCFTAPYSGAGSQVSRTVPMVNDSLVIDYENKAAVTLYGFCSGGTGTTNSVFADNVPLGNGQSISQGGSCATNTTPWAGNTSLPFEVTTGSTTLALQTRGGDCDNSQGWFDNVRVRKYRAAPPIVSLDTTPPLTLNNLPAGTYTLTLIDVNGVSTAYNILVTEPGALQLTMDSINNPCVGVSQGSVWVTASNGNSPYSYSWSDGSTTDTINALAAGTYSVSVADNNGCSASASAQVTQLPGLSLTTQGDTTICFGTSTGSAWTSITGGQTPYTYLWSNASISDTIINLPAGTYTVTATDNNGCTATGAAQITELPALQLSTFAEDALCFGTATGSAWAITTGGQSPYAYVWSNSFTTDTITGLSVGSFSITVNDAYGCSTTGLAVVNEPVALSVNLSAQSPACVPPNSGTATASVSGGTAPYAYLWSDGSSNSQPTGLIAGSYTLTVTDGNLCTISQTVNVPSPPILSISQTQVTEACPGISNGGVTVQATNGQAPITYLWSNGESAANAIALSSGPASVTATDAQGCSATFSGTVPVENFTVLINANPSTTVQSGTEVMLSLQGSGIVSAVWSPTVNVLDASGSSVSVVPIASTVYTAAIISNRGCTDTATVGITLLPESTWLIPTAFSPNGDGVNDVFHVILRGDADLVNLSIYNRWGEKVFENNTWDAGWDGTFRGVAQPMGVYTYILQVKYKQGAGSSPTEGRGNITLLR